METLRISEIMLRPAMYPEPRTAPETPKCAGPDRFPGGQQRAPCTSATHPKHPGRCCRAFYSIANGQTHHVNSYSSQGQIWRSDFPPKIRKMERACFTPRQYSEIPIKSAVLPRLSSGIPFPPPRQPPCFHRLSKSQTDGTTVSLLGILTSKTTGFRP